MSELVEILSKILVNFTYFERIFEKFLYFRKFWVKFVKTSKNINPSLCGNVP